MSRVRSAAQAQAGAAWGRVAGMPVTGNIGGTGSEATRGGEPRAAASGSGRPRAPGELLVPGTGTLDVDPGRAHTHVHACILLWQGNNECVQRTVAAYEDLMKMTVTLIAGAYAAVKPLLDECGTAQVHQHDQPLH